MNNFLETLHFVPLSNELLNSSYLFDCGHPDLNDFFNTIKNPINLLCQLPIF